MFNKEKTLEKVIKLKELYDSGEISRFAQHELHPDLEKSDRLNYIYFTLPVSLNFQRSSPAMWQSALQTFNDPNTHVIQCSIKLGLIEKEIDRERLAEIWHTLLKGSGINPIDMHPVLWNWSRAKFLPEV